MKNVCALCAVFGLVATAYAQPERPDRPPHRPDGPPSAKSIFEKLDANGDGSLSMEEFEKGHAGLRQPQRHEKMAERIKHGPPPFARPDHGRGAEKSRRGPGKEHGKRSSHHKGFRHGPPMMGPPWMQQRGFSGPPPHIRRMMAQRWSGRFSNFGRSRGFGPQVGPGMMGSGSGRGPQAFHGHRGPQRGGPMPPRGERPEHRGHGEHMKPGPRGPHGPEHGERGPEGRRPHPGPDRGEGPERKGPPRGERGPGPDRKGPPHGDRDRMADRGEFEHQFSEFMDNVEGRRPERPGSEQRRPERSRRPENRLGEKTETRTARKATEEVPALEDQSEPATSEESKPQESEAEEATQENPSEETPADAETPADKA